MLVLSRQRDEVVVIDLGDGRICEVCVADIRGEKVRLGFTAPRSCIIHRKEVWEAIKRGESPKEVNGDLPSP